MGAAAAAVSAAALSAAAALARRFAGQRVVRPERATEVSEAPCTKVPPPLDEASTSADAESEPATVPHTPAAGGSLCHLCCCPWSDGLAYFLASDDLARVSGTCSALQGELTVPGVKGEGPSRLLLVPAVDLRIESAEAELRRISVPHVRILRLCGRLSLSSAASAAKRSGPQTFRHLEKFVLKGCPLHPADIKELLEPMLCHTEHLKLLNVEKNQVTDEVVERLCSSDVLAPGRVDTLNLRFNHIGDRGAVALAACPGTMTLRWINLKMNRVSDRGALALASMLQRNDTMTLLNLRQQMPGLTDKAAVGFAEALKTNSSLERLRLRRNKIGSDGAASLAAAAQERIVRLCRSRSPQEDVRLELDLEQNRVKDMGGLALLRVGALATKLHAENTTRRLRVELLLHSNPVTRDSLCKAVLESGEPLDAMNPNVSFESKPQFDL